MRLVGSMVILMRDSCAGGLTVETTSWEPIRHAAETQKQTTETKS